MKSLFFSLVFEFFGVIAIILHLLVHPEDDAIPGLRKFNVTCEMEDGD